MQIADARIGLLAKFTAVDETFHYGGRKGKVGVIVADAEFNPLGTNFGSGTCLWLADNATYVTALADLTPWNIPA